MAEQFRITYRITPSAMVDAGRLYQSSLLARYRALMIVVIVVGMALGLAVNWTTGLPVAAVGVVLLGMTWMQFLDRWLLRSRGRGLVGGTTEFVVDEQGIHYTNPLSTGTLAWSALTQVRANERSIVFGRDRVIAAYIPTSAFASPSERGSFLAFVRARVGVPDASSHPGQSVRG